MMKRAAFLLLAAGLLSTTSGCGVIHALIYCPFGDGGPVLRQGCCCGDHAARPADHAAIARRLAVRPAARHVILAALASRHAVRPADRATAAPAARTALPAIAIAIAATAGLVRRAGCAGCSTGTAIAAAARRTGPTGPIRPIVAILATAVGTMWAGVPGGSCGPGLGYRQRGPVQSADVRPVSRQSPAASGAAARPERGARRSVRLGRGVCVAATERSVQLRSAAAARLPSLPRSVPEPVPRAGPVPGAGPVPVGAWRPLRLRKVMPWGRLQSARAGWQPAPRPTALFS